jgi:mannose-6-phosphate isomerase-like protein (cupin superfamily)
VQIQTPIDPNRPVGPQVPPKIHRVEVQWHAVTYKTVIVYAVLALAIILAGLYIISPNSYSAIFTRISNSVSSPEPDAVPVSQTKAKFVNLDGRVQVKRVDSVRWVEADYRTGLDKGDLVQTGADGMARIAFADGTFYTVKQDTLITVEENSMANDRPKATAITINTGQVDLGTSPDSKAVVHVEDATAQVRPNTRAAVKSDPHAKESEFLVSNGSMQIQRGADSVEVKQNQKVSIPTGGPITKTDVLASPELVQPLNLQPVIVPNPKTASIHFEWRPVPEASYYTVRVSTTSMFTNVTEKRTSGTSADLTGLDAGDYFWTVVATNSKKLTSEISLPFKFTLVAQGKTQDMFLEIDATPLHGRVVEIIGRTEPGAALIIDGQHVPNIAPDGTFRHFTEPLQPGEHTIVVIGQNRRGGTATNRVSIVVPK